jgi:alkylation response protein AidB-like acyl-CoA dehydrogenase
MQSSWVLSDDLLERCAQRAADYDRENRFFFEDFDELREAKYLLAAVPTEFGGLGLTLAEICWEQRRLSRRSAPTALATNMHLGATGVAADLWRKGDRSQVWMLEEAARGAVFAYGYSESGNDLEVLYAAGKSERADGGYRFFGHKHFGSLTPCLDLAQHLRVRRRRPRRPENSARCHGSRHRGLPDRRNLGHARHAGDRQPGHSYRGSICT